MFETLLPVTPFPKEKFLNEFCCLSCHSYTDDTALDRSQKGLSIEKVLEGLPKDSENRSACQSVLYTAVRQRALLQKLSSDLISRAPADDVLALIELALGLLSEGKEKPFTVVNEAVATSEAFPQNGEGGQFRQCNIETIRS